MNIGEFFGTLQESITTEWRKHLQTGKYSDHMALDDFYKEMPEKVDALIEAWQADNDIVEDYSNVLDDDMNALEYMEALKKLTKEGRKLLGSSELESLCDDILTLIDSTIYKLKRLKESLMPLSAFLNEALVNEAAETWPQIVGIIQKAIDGASPAETDSWKSVFTRFSETLDLNSLEKLIKKNKPAAIKRADEDNKSAWVGFKKSKEGIVEISFCDCSKCSKLHRGNAQNIEYNEPNVGADYHWTNAPGERVTVYECPAEIVGQIFDIIKSKY